MATLQHTSFKEEKMIRSKLFTVVLFVLGVFVMLSVTMRPVPVMAAANHPSVSEMLIVPFANGIQGVTTTNSYNKMMVDIKGIGEASGHALSDAFYIYTDQNHHPITPVHPTVWYNWTLWIEGGPAGGVISIPPYDPSHHYTFVMWGGYQQVNFAVGDTYTADNIGSYTITITAVN